MQHKAGLWAQLFASWATAVCRARGFAAPTGGGDAPKSAVGCGLAVRAPRLLQSGPEGSSTVGKFSAVRPARRAGVNWPSIRMDFFLFF